MAAPLTEAARLLQLTTRAELVREFGSLDLARARIDELLRQVPIHDDPPRLVRDLYARREVLSADALGA